MASLRQGSVASFYRGSVSGKVKGIRFRTLARMCAALQCTPGELLGYEYAAEDLDGAAEAEMP